MLLQGGGEKTSAPGPQPAGWEAAGQGDVVEGGYWVRTLANSQMGLTVPSRNQIRLNQNSVLQVKTEEEAQAFQQARVKLAKGRAWSQARPRPNDGTAVKGGPSLAMETPAATLSIRGTDWEVEVGEDGALQVVVLSGRVDVGNEKGEVSVGAGEAARARIGEAPQKLVLVDPGSRVQWVSSWAPRPGRWIGEEAAQYAAVIAQIEAGDYEGALPGLLAEAGRRTGAAVLAADLLVYRGELAQAAGLLEPKSADPRALALLARVLLRLDRGEEARTRLEQGLGAHPQAGELWLARGEVAVLEGDAAGARAAFNRALEGSTGAEGWYGLGLVSAEREYVQEARQELEEALRRDPGLEKAAAERAAVETFAGNLREADRRYAEVLAKAPSNYVALTGRGINRLKEGEAEGALQDFLRAGLVEPRYARGWMYQGVAFYRLGERYRADQAFGKAGALDAKDPVVHMMASQVAADDLAYGEAIAEARAAQSKMPYLKSLNQLANDQRGSANLGSPLADFGLEAWAKYYADEAYSPYWGGSHLFLSDRFTGLFLKNSALYSGFLTDPLVFGASNRHSELVTRPGHYGRAETQFLRDDWEEIDGSVTLNGLGLSPVPLAYFLNVEGGSSDERRTESSADAGRVTLGLGARAGENLDLFAFFNDYRISGEFLDRARARFPDDDLAYEDLRADLGANLRLGPSNQIWLKGGHGKQHTEITGEYFDRALATGLGGLFSRPEFFDPAGSVPRFEPEVEVDELQFRHAFALGDTDLHWGLEWADRSEQADIRFRFRPREPRRTPRLFIDTAQQQDIALESRQFDAGFRRALGDRVDLQLDVLAQETALDREEAFGIALPTIDFDSTYLDSLERRHFAELNPRLGLALALPGQQKLRLVAQRWRRPASDATLSPIETLGIPLNDALPAEGGFYERTR
ncbi:MAG: FecR domain-containing protein, partial [Gammaproteobacteria bacterium]